MPTATIEELVTFRERLEEAVSAVNAVLCATPDNADAYINVIEMPTMTGEQILISSKVTVTI